jgi:hypothetical protein
MMHVSHNHGVSGSGVTIQLVERADEFSPKRIQVDVADQLAEVCIFFAHDALVPVLEQMAVAAVAAIIVLGVAREKPPHQWR